MTAPVDQIAEIQGLYGPITVSERLLQKIWLRGEFDRNHLHTSDGRNLSILAAGAWNFQEGPDFLDAELEIDGVPVSGDVEIHFYARDWAHHGHDLDSAFGRVVLHVVLFEPPPGRLGAIRKDGQMVPTWVMLPHLNRDLEDFATDDALLTLERREDAGILSGISRIDVAQRRVLLTDKARTRWRQKVEFAASRITQCGWNQACHSLFMEVLGYRRNRAPMAALASRFSLAEMENAAVSAEYYFGVKCGKWKLAGVRPANHPKKRIAQYLALIRNRSEWPRNWIRFAETVIPKQPFTGSPGEFRRLEGFADIRRCVEAGFLMGSLSGTRLDTLLCDALLPLYAARGSDSDFVFPFWFCWFGGDIPKVVGSLLKQAQVADGRSWPFCNGLHQGAMQLILEQ